MRTWCSTTGWCRPKCSISRAAMPSASTSARRPATRTSRRTTSTRCWCKLAQRRQARVPAQGRRSVHLRSRRRGARSARGRRRPLRSRAGHHRRRGLRRLCRHSAHASRPRAVADVRDRPLQGRDATTSTGRRSRVRRRPSCSTWASVISRTSSRGCASTARRPIAPAAVDRAGHARDAARRDRHAGGPGSQGRSEAGSRVAGAADRRRSHAPARNAALVQFDASQPDDAVRTRRHHEGRLSA